MGRKVRNFYKFELKIIGQMGFVASGFIVIAILAQLVEQLFRK